MRHFIVSHPAVAITTILAVLLLPLPSAFSEDEYTVAFWGQTHTKEAVYLHQTLSPSDFRLACRQGIRKLLLHSPSRVISKRTYSAWAHFTNPERLAYCRKFPHKTWYLLGEAPYFMLPSAPGIHK